MANYHHDAAARGIRHKDLSGNGEGALLGANTSNMTSADWDRITPSDTTILARPFRAIRVGTAGDIAVRMLDGSTTIINEVQAGETVSVQGVGIFDTNTTATEVEVLY